MRNKSTGWWLVTALKFGIAYAAVAAVWEARWTIAACAVAGGLAVALATALLLRFEGRR